MSRPIEEIMDLKIERDGVFFVKKPLVKIGDEEIKLFKEEVLRNSTQSIRFCMHRDVSDPVHEMFILHSKKTYIRPHKHPNKDLSYHIIEGVADMIVFDEEGQILDIIALGEYGSRRNYFYRLNKVSYYVPLIYSDFLLFRETTNGPFKLSDTIYAPWAAERDNPTAIEEFQRELAVKVNQFLRVKTGGLSEKEIIAGR